MDENDSSNHQTEEVFDRLDRISKIDLEIARRESKLNEIRVRARYVIISFLLIALALVITTLTGVLNSLASPTFGKEFLFLMAAYITVIALVMPFYLQIQTARRQTEIDELNAQKRILTRLDKTSAGDTASATYFESLVQINIENLGAYYAQVKNHAERGFMASLAVAIVGFALIATGLILGFVRAPNAQTLAYISSGSGVITEFIAAIFFYLYNRTVRQMKDYHDSLLSVQNILLSFKIVEDTKEESEKVKMVTQMIGFLVGKAHD
ncbi:MAG TPA: hypothetical protein VE136_12020 [Anaerolineales bacterium]|jgi:uncharacterized RDD family membrane protein YckC|nr:hypothetical protein [Anaerolineales bacterium]